MALATARFDKRITTSRGYRYYRMNTSPTPTTSSCITFDFSFRINIHVCYKSYCRYEENIIWHLKGGEKKKKKQTSILNSLDRVTYFAIMEQIFAVRSPLNS